MKKHTIIIIISIVTEWGFAQCDSTYTYFSELPDNVTILVGDSCFYNDDIAVLDSMVSQNNLDYGSSLELGTQTWFNGRLRFLVAGNYGNSSGVNDTIYTLPENIGDLTDLASLYLEWNRISELPESFSEMTGLFSCYLNNNVLTSIGDSIGNLLNLYFLDLGYNELPSIPESICNLENLSYLWLFNNNLETLPDCFCNMNIDWNNDDNGGYPYFAIGANNLCDSVASCVSESEHFELSLDQFYYSFPVYSPQDCDSTTTYIDKNYLPYQYNVSAPYPNPFNPAVTLDLNIPYDRKMDVRIYDIMGNEIETIFRNAIFEKGLHSIVWRADNYPSGVYYIKLSDGLAVRIRKMIFIR